MAMKATPESAREKWVNRSTAASAEMAAGVDRVTKAPGQAAVEKRQKWESALAEQATRDKWARNTSRVSAEEWKQSMRDVGVPRHAQGVQAKQTKYERFASEFFPHLERGLQQIDQMPDNTFEQRVQKSVAMMQHNRKFKRSS